MRNEMPPSSPGSWPTRAEGYFLPVEGLRPHLPPPVELGVAHRAAPRHGAGGGDVEVVAGAGERHAAAAGCLCLCVGLGAGAGDVALHGKLQGTPVKHQVLDAQFHRLPAWSWRGSRSSIRPTLQPPVPLSRPRRKMPPRRCAAPGATSCRWRTDLDAGVAKVPRHGPAAVKVVPQRRLAAAAPLDAARCIRGAAVERGAEFNPRPAPRLSRCQPSGPQPHAPLDPRPAERSAEFGSRPAHQQSQPTGAQPHVDPPTSSRPPCRQSPLPPAGPARPVETAIQRRTSRRADPAAPSAGSRIAPEGRRER